MTNLPRVVTQLRPDRGDRAGDRKSDAVPLRHYAARPTAGWIGWASTLIPASQTDRQTDRQPHGRQLANMVNCGRRGSE